MTSSNNVLSYIPETIELIAVTYNKHMLKVYITLIFIFY